MLSPRRRRGKKEFRDMAEAEKQQLVRKLDERVIERAEADPQWKRLFVEDPPTAVADMPEAQKLREINESVRPTERQSPEATILTPTEEYKQLSESLTDKVLDRAASDPLWKERLLTDPQAAMLEADFPEYRRLEEIRQEAEEVRGHYMNLMALDPAGGAFDYYVRPKCDGGYYTRASDRNLKEYITPINEYDILTRLADVPIESWNYKGQNPSIRHIGPMAQDFAAAFDVGEDDKHISMVDANGVAFAAIQALYRMIREKDEQIGELQDELNALKQRITESATPA
jgi:hypothetical protein